jgi:activator of 2-hydroxyglutaryl-CoA dehydratase
MMAGGEELDKLEVELQEMNRASNLIMQIGIDLGATKIEYVLLDNNNKELNQKQSSYT